MTRTEPSRQRIHRMPHGAELQDDGRVRFRLWAPAHQRIELVLDEGAPVPMAAGADGWHELVTAAGAGTSYRFVLPDGLHVPDPASRYQPDDVHGASQVIDPGSHRWADGGWRGRPWHEAVIYELHVGSFTEQGTFLAAIDRLDHLIELGVTAIELMPIGDFPGGRNWGYDGAYLYAPDASYGHPDDLKRLVEAAHARGLMVLLDVVYNHFGPDGNYLSTYAPGFFTERHHTPWGAAINYDGKHSRPVRDFVVHNALYWLEEFHLDGLRLDAVHAIIDDSDEHLLDELARRVAESFPDRHVHLILENEENEASRLGDRVAQWNDDLHHVLHTAATGEGDAYYAEYLGDTSMLARAIAEGFAFQGGMMGYRERARGEPSAHLPPTCFVAFVQNHDQIGNRAFGDRLGTVASLPALKAVTAVCHLLPQIPMLFMGEEWATGRPFPFFCDFDEDLSKAVREGRLREFARFPQFADEAIRRTIPDPTSLATFESAKLDWPALAEPAHAEMLAWYRRLLAARHATVVPLLPRIGRGGEAREVGELAVQVVWQIEGGGRLELAANLKDRPEPGFPSDDAAPFWQEGAVAQNEFGPWAVRWTHRPPAP